MTKVNCGLEICRNNKDGICAAGEISLAGSHYCDGGCDSGWDIPEERDCDTCYWSQSNGHWSMPFCHCLHTCVNYEHWKPKREAGREE